VTYQEQSGNCGPQSSQTLAFDGTKGPSSDCGGRYQSTTDQCQDTFELQCSLGPGQVVRRSGSLAWTTDGRKAEGPLVLSVLTLMTDSTGQVIEEHAVCTSSYRVVCVKL
jgi:hypothetical protein